MNELDFAFYSDVGGRANNEDAYLAKKIEGGYLFIVADGLGGHDCGEVASSSAIQAIKDFLVNNGTNDLLGAIRHANEIILQLQKGRSSKMKTTVTVALVEENKTVIAHVGDSRVYAFKHAKIVHQTVDHSASQMAVLAGEIMPSQIRHHEDRNVLLRALGAGENVKVEMTEIASDWDALLLCSDGFWEYVLEEEMESALSVSTGADKWLYKMRALQLDRAPANCDNNTAVAVMR